MSIANSLHDSLLFGLGEDTENLLDIPLHGVSSSSDSGHTDTDSIENENTSSGRWTTNEHEIFLAGLKEHGKGWKKIAEMIVTRNVVQVRTHAQKYFQKLERSKQSIAGVSPVLTTIKANTDVGVAVFATAVDSKSTAMQKSKRKNSKDYELDNQLQMPKKGKKTAMTLALPISSDSFFFEKSSQLKIDLEGTHRKDINNILGTPSPTSISEEVIINAAPKVSLADAEPPLDDWVVGSNSSLPLSGDLMCEAFEGDHAVGSNNIRVKMPDPVVTHTYIDSDVTLGELSSEFYPSNFDDDIFVKGILEIFDI